MEKLKLQLSLDKIHLSLSLLSHPDTAWRFILSVTFCALLSLGVAGVIIFGWASHPTPTTYAPKKDITITKEELNTTINLYLEKQDRFYNLATHKPTPPLVDSGYGVDVVGSFSEEQDQVDIPPLIPSNEIPQ